MLKVWGKGWLGSSTGTISSWVEGLTPKTSPTATRRPGAGAGVTLCYLTYLSRCYHEEVKLPRVSAQAGGQRTSASSGPGSGASLTMLSLSAGLLLIRSRVFSSVNLPLSMVPPLAYRSERKRWTWRQVRSQSSLDLVNIVCTDVDVGGRVVERVLED